MNEKVFTDKDSLEVSNHKIITIPEEFTSIGEFVFYQNYDLIAVELPQNLVEIENCAFAKCINLRNIKLPKTLEKIGDNAFYDCESLESIIIPENILKIGEGTFWNCKDLQNIKLPENLEGIADYAFGKCITLKKIIIPDKVKYIGIYAFCNCESLKKIIIPDSVSYIQQYAFSDCCSLEEVELPKNLKNIDNGAFERCILKTVTVYANCREPFIRYLGDFRNKSLSKTLSKIIVKYDNFFELYNFMKLLNKFFYGSKLNVELVGKKINVAQKIKLKSALIFNNKFELVYKEISQNILEDSIFNNMIQSDLSEEIKNLLQEIDNISCKLPSKLKNTINNKITLMIDNYYKEMDNYSKNERPTLNFDKNEVVDLKIEQINPEVTLVINLKRIKFDLSNYEKLLKNLSSVYKCKELLTTKVESKPKELNSLEEIVTTIVYLTNKIDDKKKEEVIGNVNKYLDITENKYNKDLNDLFNVDSRLGVFEELDTDKQLKVDLLNILDDLVLYSKRMTPYLMLLESLTCKEVTTYVESDDINDTIKSMKYLIGCITNDNNRKQLEKEFNDFKDEYIKKINNILSNYKDINETDYKKLENEIVKRIHPILEKVNLYSNKDKNEKYILSQLSSSINILNNKEIVKIDKKKIIEFWIGEIHNTIINNNQMFDIEKQEIKLKLLNIINDWMEKIDNMSDGVDMNKVMQDILKDIADVYFKVDMFINDLNQVNNKTKKLIK